MKQILIIFLMLQLYVQKVFADNVVGSIDIKQGIVQDLQVNSGSGNLNLSNLSKWLKEELYTITFVIAVAAIVYVGIKMVMARGNPEDFKKAWMHFVYIILGIFLVFASLGIVRLIVGLGNNF